MKLANRIALVTGGGSGIGRAIALLFASEGAAVVVNDIDLASAEATVASIQSAAAERGGSSRPGSLAVGGDVADPAQVRAMFEQVDAAFDGLDVLVNNAGIAEISKDRFPRVVSTFETQIGQVMMGQPVTAHLDSTMDLPDEDWARMLAVHLNGTFSCTREALRRMAKRGRGSIVNMASVAAQAGIPSAPHYSAAKAGIVGFTKAVAGDVATRGIRVNVLCPGWIETAMTGSLSTHPMIGMMLKSRIPQMRFGQPGEVAAAALFLASDDSSYMTGQSIALNGGMLMP